MGLYKKTLRKDVKFEELEIEKSIIEALYLMGFKEPTPIQEKAIPFVLKGGNLLGLAETGSGKTAASVIPVCQKIDPSNKTIQGLIIVPTRELALQYSEEAQKIGKIKKIKVFAILGGEDFELQLAKLKNGVHLLIATPGRLIDFIYARHIDLSFVKILVVDEADQMLSFGFFEDLVFIMQCLQQKYQMLLFSATMPNEIKQLLHEQKREFTEIRLTEKRHVPKNLQHRFILGTRQQKLVILARILQEIEGNQSLIFANSRKDVENIYQYLKGKVEMVDFLHGGLDQRTRLKITTKFSKGKLRYLIATDVAARGLDFAGITHVVNYQLPFEDETYTHRAGRTARAGREGMCITLVTPGEKKRVSLICKALAIETKWETSFKKK